MNKKGFTLIEILIAMTIFGFLIYAITGILISIVQIVYSLNQKSYLRNDLETIASTVTQDLQFATNVSACGGHTSCIIFAVPSLSQNGVNTNTELLYYDSSLQTITKSVTINGSSTSVTTDLNNKAKVAITSAAFTINGNNILFTEVGQVDTGYGNGTYQQPLSAIIQYGKY